MGTKKWVSMQKLAKSIGVSRQTVQKWTERGNIKWKYDDNLCMKVVDPESINIKTVTKDENGNWIIKSSKNI